MWFFAISLLLCTENDQMVDVVIGGQVATLSTMHKEFPFGSLVPYAVDKKGNPLIFVSDMAAHTKNLNKNSACSIMIMKLNKDNVFNSARVTLVGKMEKLAGEEAKAMKKIYIAKHEAAEILTDFADFNIYRMKIEKIQYIGGFGDINWLKPEDYSKRYQKVIKEVGMAGK